MIQSLTAFDLVLVISVAITAFALFIFVYIRENAITKKLKAYERAIEQLYMMINKKEPSSINANSKADFDEATSLILERFKILINENAAFKESVLQKISDLEHKSNYSPQINTLTPNNTNFESRIIQLFENGLSADEIADQLRISIGEVELALNLNGFKR